MKGEIGCVWNQDVVSGPTLGMGLLWRLDLRHGMRCGCWEVCGLGGIVDWCGIFGFGNIPFC